MPPKIKKLFSRVCPYCKVKFETKLKKQRFCSARHKNAAAQRRWRENLNGRGGK